MSLIANTWVLFFGLLLFPQYSHAGVWESCLRILGYEISSSSVERSPAVLPFATAEKMERLKTKYTLIAKGPKGMKTDRALKELARDYCTPEQKVELWNLFMEKVQKLNPNVQNESARGADGSWIFRGRFSILIIDPEGKIYTVHLTHGEPGPDIHGWQPPYSQMVDWATKYQLTPHSP